MRTLPSSAANAVPALDEDLAFLLDGLAGAHPGIDMIRDGIRHLAVDKLSADQTQVILYSLAGSEGMDVLTAVGLLLKRIADSQTNPSLRALPGPVQQELRDTVTSVEDDMTDLVPRQIVADAIGLIGGTR